jgi:site-specific DNA recombinase
MISASAAHPALVSEADFVAAQRVRAARATKDGTARRYRLSGLVACGVCGRRLDSHWVHGRAGYRCRHGYASSKPRRLNEVKNVHVREDVLLEELMARLSPTEGGREPDAAPSAVDRMISELRASGRMVVHDGSGWVLEPD